MTSVYSKLKTKTPKKYHNTRTSTKPFAVPLRKEIFQVNQVNDRGESS